MNSIILKIKASDLTPSLTMSSIGLAIKPTVIICYLYVHTAQRTNIYLLVIIFVKQIMKNRQFFEITEMPVTSSLLSDCFFEIPITGLLASPLSLGGPKREQFLTYMTERLRPIVMLFSVAEKYFGAKLKLHSFPILYNSKFWTPTKILGGYSDSSTNIKASELAISYLACWRLEGCHVRLAKATIWYIRSRGNFKDGINYLVDLFEAGYIINENEFAAAGKILVELYAKLDNPFRTINELSLDLDPKTTDLMLKALREATANQYANEQRLLDIFSWILKMVLDETTKARSSNSIGEFVLSKAKIRGLSKVLLNISELYKSTIKLSLAEQAILSQLEEISADIFAEQMGFITQPRHFPLVGGTNGLLHISMNYASYIAKLYKQKYGDDGIEKLFDDRLLVPDYLKEMFRQKFSKSEAANADVKFDSFSEEWNYFPLTFVLFFGMIKDIKPSLMRSELFAKEILLNEILDLYRAANLSKNEIQSTLDEQYSLFRSSIAEETHEDKQQTEEEKRLKSKESIKHFIKTNFYDIYIYICNKELEMKILPLIRDHDKQNTEEVLLHTRSQLEELSKLYPWNPAIYHERCINSDWLGDRKGALDNIQAAILVEPTQESLWQSLQVVCSKFSTQDDNRFASLIRYMLRSAARKEDSQSLRRIPSTESG